MIFIIEGIKIREKKTKVRALVIVRFLFGFLCLLDLIKHYNEFFL